MPCLNPASVTPIRPPLIFKRFQILGLVLMAYAVLQPLAGLLKGPDMKKEGFLLRTVTRATVILLLGEYLIDLRIGLNMYREHSCLASVETLSPFQGDACCTG